MKSESTYAIATLLPSMMIYLRFLWPVGLWEKAPFCPMIVESLVIVASLSTPNVGFFQNDCGSERGGAV